jgi:glycosyltransferase involved in cell wall biosynthesis
LEKIEFVIPTYKDSDKLMGMLYSLINQSNNNWVAHVVSDGNYDEFKDIEQHFCLNSQIKFSTIEGPNKDWGHTARNYGLENVSEEWVVMTGADNYYMPDFVNEFLKISNVDPDYNFIFCNMIHNEAHYNHYQLLEANMSEGNIDMGCFATKSKQSKQLKLNTNSYIADWLFVEKFITLYPSRINHINKVLYVHN